MTRRTVRSGIAVALVMFSLVQGCRSGPALPGANAPRARAAVASLEAIEARLARLAAHTEPATTTRACHARAPSPAGALAIPAECTLDDIDADQRRSRDAMHTVVLALVRDLAPIVARLQEIVPGTPFVRSQWKTITLPVLSPTAHHLDRLTFRLERSIRLIEQASGERDASAHDAVLRRAGHEYTAALLGAQVIAAWMPWLELARLLHADTMYSAERILVHLRRQWDDMDPVLSLLQSPEPGDVQRAARALQAKRVEWTDALRAWSVDAERYVREQAEMIQKLLIVQTALELVSLRAMVGPRIGNARAFVLVLPGIGGITAGGAAMGVRLVVSAEWVGAIQHLIAIGAITTIEIVKLAGLSSLASPPNLPPPGAPAVPGGASGPPVVLVQHRGGSRQVAVNGQRWHVPKHKSSADIPASDPVGDRLQATIDRIAGEWHPGKLTQQELDVIDKARTAGRGWHARLLERQARGRWVEQKARREFTAVRWNSRGVDAVDPRTGLQYEVLSGTPSNIDLHGRRMAGEMFRMITF